jgi:hypothetical protein
MNRKGVCYDTGRMVDGRSWRPEFDPAEARRELAIIRNDLHCNAVKITGDNIGRVTAVAADALEQELEAWLSPDVWDHGSARHARRAWARMTSRRSTAPPSAPASPRGSHERRHRGQRAG